MIDVALWLTLGADQRNGRWDLCRRQGIRQHLQGITLRQSFLNQLEGLLEVPKVKFNSLRSSNSSLQQP